MLTNKLLVLILAMREIDLWGVNKDDLRLAMHIMREID